MLPLTRTTAFAFMLVAACGTPETNIEFNHDALDDHSVELILALVNNREVTQAMLDHDAGLDRRAATNIVDHRNGPDGIESTGDDQQFETLAELDEVRYVGRSALNALLVYASSRHNTSNTPVALPRARFNYSERVFNDVASEFGIQATENLLIRAEAFDDGNRYLNRSELTLAAHDVQRDQAIIRGFRYSTAIVDRLMNECTLRDRLAFLAQAVRHNSDGNKYLKTSELNHAKHMLTHPTQEIGIISDLDRTLLPHAGNLYTYLNPFAGATTLLGELEHAQGRKSGNTYYVTTRSPNVLGDVPQWLRDHRFPTGTIDTGIGPQPWISQPEKVADIARILDANPNMPFVLFGDSNHRDPEAYAEIMQRYPGRIAGVFIHRVNNIRSGRTEGMMVYEELHETAIELLNSGLLTELSTRRVLEAARNEGANLSEADIDALVSQNSLAE